MRIYIAGPMRGLPRYNFDEFDKAEERLRASGRIPVSPARMDRAIWGFDGSGELTEGMRRETVFPIDVQVIPTCHGMYLLRGWEKSAGAILEVAYAQALGLQISYEDGACRSRVGVVSETS